MSLQGLVSFSVTAVPVVIGLLVAWVASKQLDTEHAKRYVRIGDAIAAAGYLLPSFLRVAGYSLGEIFERSGAPSRAVIIIFLGGIYIPLQVLATGYTQYRKNRDDGACAQAFIKQAVANLIGTAVMFSIILVGTILLESF